jgi:putative transposase
VTTALSHLIPLVGVAAACVALAVCRASYYRARKLKREPKSRPTPVRALSAAENAEVLAVLDSERFGDKPPRQVYAELLDEGRYLCSVRTMYRILAKANQVRERRLVARHPKYVKPVLLAEAPNQVWSWDITKVPGPVRGVYYSLYVALDIYSRYIVGWVLASGESGPVARAFLREACERHRVAPDQLVCHSDRGGPMLAKPTTMLYADLGIIPSYSRPHVSDDNPYSEAAFKTFLYRPEMPERFGSLEHARAFFAELFDWYNEHHCHSGIALLTPADVHHGRAADIVAARQSALDAAYARHPERFVRQAPRHPMPAAAVWINPPPADRIRITDRIAPADRLEEVAAH